MVTNLSITESKTITTASFGVQALAALAGVYPLRIVPRLVQLCSLLAGNTLSDDDNVESDAEGSERGSGEEDAKMATDESEDEEDVESETTAPKEEYRYNLLLLVCNKVREKLVR